MDDILKAIITASSLAFGISEEDFCSATRKREAVMARRVAALVCRKENIPARVLADRIGVARWSVNRMQTAAMFDSSPWFSSKVDEVTGKISTLKAHSI